MYKNILVPVSLDEHRDTHGSFVAARALADEGAAFTVLHVMESIPNFATFQVPAELLAKARHETEDKLGQAASALPKAETVMMSGHAGRTISDYAAENDIDCIVLASHRPGFADLFLGSTADWVVRHARCSVHVVR